MKEAISIFIFIVLVFSVILYLMFRAGRDGYFPNKPKN